MPDRPIAAPPAGAGAAVGAGAVVPPAPAAPTGRRMHRSGRGLPAGRRRRPSVGVPADPPPRPPAQPGPGPGPGAGPRSEAAIDTAEAEDHRREIFAQLLSDQPFTDEEPDEPTGPPPYVTVVLVAHNGARWLPTTLAALRVQDRAPERVVAVDTGSTDASPRMLTRALGAGAVVLAPMRTGYGEAISRGLAATPVPAEARAERREWVWLLHDDSAPAPDALSTLLQHAGRNPSVAILGAKAVDWDRPDRLVDIGQSTDAAGRRETYLEPGEIDQGQHERPRDVLAVGTAGALVRRDAWDALSGFDPALPLLREDVDFGWRAVRSGRRVAVVPSARVRHARATLTGRRDGALVPRVGRTDRAHALYVSLLDGGAGGGLLRLPRLLVGVLLRALVLLLTRRVVAAYEELLAGLDVLGHPGRVLAGRRWRAGQLTLPPRAAAPLLSRGSTRLRTLLLATTDRISGVVDPVSPTAEDPDGGPAGDAGVLRRVLLRPGLGLLLALLVIALVADRHLLTGSALSGGRLLPVDGGAGGLWRTYLAGWHDVGGGSGSAASPWLPVLALVSIPFGAHPAAVLTVLLLGAVPLAGVSVWLALRRTRLSRPLRLWAAATYALLPPVVGAGDGGRFDAVVAAVALPLLLASGVRVVRGRGGNHAVALGLAIALAAAFSPPVWSLAVVLLIGGVVAEVLPIGRVPTREALRRLGAAASAIVVAPLLLLPWSLTAVTHPRVLVVGLGGPGGLAGTAGRAVGPEQLLLLHPGGHGLPPVWVAAPLVVAAVVAVLRPARGLAAAAAVAVAVVGLLGGLLAARTGSSPVGGPPQGWSGVGLSVAALGLLTAALLGAHRARKALTASRFGLQQPAAVVLAVLCAAIPVVSAVWLVGRGVGDPLGRGGSQAITQLVVDDAVSDPGQRLLTLRESGGHVAYGLSRVAGARLGDEDLRQSPAARDLLAHLAADLTSNRGTDAAETLATFHVRYVAVADRDVPALAGALDRQPGLSRFALPGDEQLWQVLVPSSRLEVASGAVADTAAAPAPASEPLGRGPTLQALATDPFVRVPAGGTGATAAVAAGSGDRLLVLADAADGHWHATVDGARLTPVTAWGWAQAFRLPTGGGTVHLSYADPGRRLGLWLELLALLVVLVLAAPSVRRTTEDVTESLTGTLEPTGVWSVEELEAAAGSPPARPRVPERATATTAPARRSVPAPGPLPGPRAVPLPGRRAAPARAARPADAAPTAAEDPTRPPPAAPPPLTPARTPAASASPARSVAPGSVAPGSVAPASGVPEPEVTEPDVIDRIRYGTNRPAGPRHRHARAMPVDAEPGDAASSRSRATPGSAPPAAPASASQPSPPRPPDGPRPPLIRPDDERELAAPRPASQRRIPGRSAPRPVGERPPLTRPPLTRPAGAAAPTEPPRRPPVPGAAPRPSGPAASAVRPPTSGSSRPPAPGTTAEPAARPGTTAGPPTGSGGRADGVPRPPVRAERSRAGSDPLGRPTGADSTPPPTASPARPETAGRSTAETASPVTPVTASPVTPVTASPVTPVTASPVTPETAGPDRPDAAGAGQVDGRGRHRHAGPRRRWGGS